MGTKRLERRIAYLLAALLLAGPAIFAPAEACYFLECDGPPNPAPAPPQQPQYTPPPPSTPSSTGRTFWNHNGSVMYLVVSGNRRQFYYHQPRQGMRDEGVGPGTLLFSGTVNANSYEGTAYLFSARCGKRAYHVSGPATENGGRVVMTGAAAGFNSRCEPHGVINDVLVFNYLYRE